MEKSASKDLLQHNKYLCKGDSVMKRLSDSKILKICNLGCYISTALVVLGTFELFSICAEAYIDPSVMTYVIQAVAGVIIAIGAAIGIYFRRTKKKIQNKLGIKETKEQESDEIITK